MAGLLPVNGLAEVTGEQAERRYYEHYSALRMEHIGEYSKPLVQQEIRRQAWAKLVSEIEAEVIARTLLPTIERDAMPVRNCIQCGTFRTNHDVAECEKEGCPLRTAPAEVVDEPQITHQGQHKADMEEAIVTAPTMFDPQPKRRGRPKKNKS